MQRNEPLLAGVRAPWDSPGWGYRQVLKPKNLWRAILFSRRYKEFWAPVSMDPWRYRRFLQDLDEVCLRSLRTHGALTARELAEWLNRGKLLRTSPEMTGICRITVATAHDWIMLARRRGYVVGWESNSGAGRRSGGHWELTEQGRKAIHSRVGALIRQFPYPSLLVAGGGLIALLHSLLEWLSVNQLAVVLILLALITALPVAAVNSLMSRFEKRANPGIAVVAIETLRSAGRPIPAL